MRKPLRVGSDLVHRVVASRALGKPLPTQSVVHHVDGNERNNANKNLVICQDQAYHKLLHQRTDALRACGHADWRRCTYCQQYSPAEDMQIYERSAQHPACRNKSKAAWRLKAIKEGKITAGGRKVKLRN